MASRTHHQSQSISSSSSTAIGTRANLRYKEVSHLPSYISRRPSLDRIEIRSAR